MGSTIGDREAVAHTAGGNSRSIIDCQHFATLARLVLDARPIIWPRGGRFPCDHEAWVRALDDVLGDLDSACEGYRFSE